MPNEDEIRERIHYFVEESHFSQTTVASIIEKLERHFACRLTSKYDFIKDEIVKFLAVIRARILLHARDMKISGQIKSSSQQSCHKKASPKTSRSPAPAKSPTAQNSEASSTSSLIHTQPISVDVEIHHMPLPKLSQRNPVLVIGDHSDQRGERGNPPSSSILNPLRRSHSLMESESSQSDGHEHQSSNSCDDFPDPEELVLKRPRFLMDLEQGVAMTSNQRKEVKLAPRLASLLGSKNMDRVEVTKRLWAIVKERNLQPPENRKLIVFDQELQNVFDCNEVKISRFPRLLDQHLEYVNAADS